MWRRDIVALLRRWRRLAGRRLNQGKNREAVRSWFDAEYYLCQYPDVRAAGVDPLDHFMALGWKENRNPTANFDTRFYLRANSDARWKPASTCSCTTSCTARRSGRQPRCVPIERKIDPTIISECERYGGKFGVSGKSIPMTLYSGSFMTIQHSQQTDASPVTSRLGSRLRRR